MDADGRNVTRLTKNKADDRAAVVARREANRLYFRSPRPTQGLRDRSCRQEHCGPEEHGSCIGQERNHVPLDWSPDGSKVVYVADDGKAIRTINVNTDETQTLLSGPAGPRQTLHVSVCWRKSDGMVILKSQNPNCVMTVASTRLILGRRR